MRESARRCPNGVASWPQIDEAAGRIRIKRAKQRGKKRVEVIEQIEITPVVSALIARLKLARAAQKNEECLHVFPNRSSTAYTQAGFKTMEKLIVEAIKKKGAPAPIHFPHPPRLLRDPAESRTRRISGPARPRDDRASVCSQ